MNTILVPPKDARSTKFPHAAEFTPPVCTIQQFKSLIKLLFNLVFEKKYIYRINVLINIINDY